jgi:CDP-diacylglycerol--glycerol-3-phosphate 3-phosphatidyltransferase
MKYAASLITIGRIFGSFLLLFIKPFSVLFFIIYTLCGISDILDGYVARRTKTESKFGELLDSIADLIMTAVILVIFIPLLDLKYWMLFWIISIALIRFISIIAGYIKFHAIAFIHTYANKITGITFFCFPFIYLMFDLTVTVFIICCLASFSAVEELAINLYSKNLNRNTASILNLLVKDKKGL